MSLIVDQRKECFIVQRSCSAKISSSSIHWTERTVEVNPSALNVLGYPAEELEGMKIYDLMDENGDKEYRKRVQELKEGGGPASFTASHRRKDGAFSLTLRSMQRSLASRPGNISSV